jgi:hypothetical protein
VLVLSGRFNAPCRQLPADVGSLADGAIAENAAQLSDQSILLAPRARRLFHYRACDGTTRVQIFSREEYTLGA